MMVLLMSASQVCSTYDREVPRSLQINEPLVSIIILNFNGKDLLRNCLSSVSKTSYSNYEVIIVDNGSTDGSCSMVEHEFPSFHLIKNSHNYGYSKGNNLGILHSQGIFVAILNNDTTVHAKWLSELVKEAVLSPMCFYQPKILFAGTNRINSAGNLIQLFGFAFPRGLGEVDIGQYSDKCEISYASGACVFGSRALIDEVGLFDQGFFTFYEDVNLGWRTLMHGYKTVYLPSAIIYHKWGGSWGQVLSNEKFFLIERSRIASSFRNYSLNSLIISFPALVFVESMVISYCSIKGFLPEKIRVYADLLRLRKVLFNQRKELQKQRKLSDPYILAYFENGLKHVYLGAFSCSVDRVLTFFAKITKRFVR